MIDNETRKRLAEKSGDSNNSRPPKYTVPLIRFDGNRGEFRKITKNDNGENVEVPISIPLEFVILKKRRLLSAFSPNKSYFTNEHNSTSDQLMLFKVIEKTVSLDDIGYTDQLREKYQTLKTHEVIYVLYDGEVCKMEIKGGSLSNYYDYQKALQSEELHSFEVETVVGSEKVKNDQGFSYFRLTFDHKEFDGDFSLVEKKIDEVVSACNESDNYTKQKIAEKSKTNGTSSGTVNGLTPEQIKSIKDARNAEIDQRKKAEEEFNNFNEDNGDSDIPF